MPKLLTQISSIPNQLKHLIVYKYQKIGSNHYRHLNSATLIYHNWEPEIIIIIDKFKLQNSTKKDNNKMKFKFS